MIKDNQSWVCREYNDGDEHRILDLFSKVFNRKMSLELWKWRFVENPFGKGIIKLLFDNRMVVGHYAVIPTRIQIAGRIVNAVFSMTTMTHPDYRGRGIFAALAKETYEEAWQKGASFVYGFPNNNSYLGFTRKLGWEGFGKMSIWEKELTGEDICNSAIIDNVTQVKQFEDDITLLWEKARQDYQVIALRTKDFLNWRFVTNPTVNYANFIFLDNKSEILGYIILKVYRTPIEVKGHIVDMLAVDDEEVITSLLNCSYKYFTKQGISKLVCWCQDGCPFSKVLRREGFIKSEMGGTYFGVKIFDQQDESLRIIEHLPAWYLTMGDSDVF